MIVVTGCPRSGTSLMMDCLRHALGDERILGFKFPQEARFEAAQKKGEDETDIHFESRQYALEKFRPSHEKKIKLSKEMNPNGFWECGYTVRGMSWHLGMEHKSNQVVKIVSQGLIRTDPKYVDKMICMCRHPRAVAKSQENLRRLPFMKQEEERKLKVHTPEQFLRVTARAAKWLIENPNTELLLVQFDNLISAPQATLKSVADFIGEGDFSDNPVDAKLKRSYPNIKIDSLLWEPSEEIYEALLNKDWEKLWTTFEAAQDALIKENSRSVCFRTGKRMAYKECISCKTRAVTRDNFRTTASKDEVDWWNEPCMFECLYDKDNESITIKESIKNNFWKENTSSIKPRRNK